MRENTSVASVKSPSLCYTEATKVDVLQWGYWYFRGLVQDEGILQPVYL